MKDHIPELGKMINGKLGMEAEKFANDNAKFVADDQSAIMLSKAFIAGAMFVLNDWVKVETRKPTEEDEQIIVTNGNGFYEIVWYCKEDGEYRKPCRYDDDDWAVFRNGNFTHWKRITPPQE